MRIIAGEFKGRAIKAITGRNTRPTTDRIREAWASTLTSAFSGGFGDIAALDVFAGTGALGIEALSRGAARVTFCERNRKAFGVLTENTASLGLGCERATLLPLDVFAPKSLVALKASGPYDLVILDPPYDLPVGKIKTLLHGLALTGSLKAGAVLSYEHREGENDGLDGTVLCAACSPASLKLLSCKSYGRITIEYLKYL
jgi:16S rRNA (guanine966-N2)-methyltransferase